MGCTSSQPAARPQPARPGTASPTLEPVQEDTEFADLADLADRSCSTLHCSTVPGEFSGRTGDIMNTTIGTRSMETSESLRSQSRTGNDPRKLGRSGSNLGMSIRTSVNSAVRRMSSAENLMSPTGTTKVLNEFDLKSVKDKRYQRERFLWEALEDGSTMLLKGSWLVDFVEEDRGRLPRRQDLPPEAFWHVSALKELGSTIWEEDKSSKTMSARNKKDGNRGKKDGKGNDKVHVMAFSFLWADAEHPDPDNVQLTKLAKAIKMRMHLPPKLKNMTCHDVALFIDYACLPQPPFSQEDREVFFRAVKNVHLWYAHDRVTVLLHLPKESNKKASGTGRRSSLFSNQSVQSIGSDTVPTSPVNAGNRTSLVSNLSDNWVSLGSGPLSPTSPPPPTWSARLSKSSLWSPSSEDKNLENRRGSKRISKHSTHSALAGGFSKFLKAVQSLIKYSDHIIDLEFLDAANVDLSSEALDEGCKPGKCTDWKDLIWKCREGCAPAYTPDVFAVELQTRQYTNGNQMELVKSGYALTLNEVLGSATQLQSVMLFASQDDSGISNSHFMSYCTSKENLNGMKALADALEDPDVYSLLELATFTIPGAAQTRANAALKQHDTKAAVFTAYNDDNQPWISDLAWGVSRSLSEIARYCHDESDFGSGFDTTIDI